VRRLLVTLTLLSGLAVMVPGEAAAIIQIDRGISGVRIDNTKRQVRAALGTPKNIDHGSNDFGPFTEFRYAGKIRVLFSGGNRVTLVSTRGLGDRTARGVGVGSTRRAVRNRVPGVTCEPPSIGLRVCHTNEFVGGQRVTSFILRNGRVIRADVGVVID
jgi:hypothetical protein